MDRKDRNKQITVSFLSFLAVGTLMSVMMPQKGFSATENRYLKKKPAFTVNGLLDGSFGTDYETYLSDQFPGRDVWIGIKVIAERAQGKMDVNGVYFGNDDYLIEKFDAEDIEGEQLTKNLDRLALFAQKAEEMLGDGRVKVMLVPSASQVMTNHLPFLAAPYDQSRVTGMLAERLDQSVIVPVEEALKERKEEDIYYKTDHHWTADGAYYGYRAWAEAAGIVPWEEDAFDRKTVSGDFLGTVYSKVNLSHRPDSIQLYLPKTKPDYEVYYDGSNEASEMYSYQALDGKDKYAVYLDGNHGLTEIRNPKVSGDMAGRKLLIIKDSFAHSFAPFAANHFGVTFMMDLRYFNLSPQTFMEEQGITDVLVLYQIPGFAGEKTVSKLIRTDGFHLINAVSFSSDVAL